MAYPEGTTDLLGQTALVEISGSELTATVCETGESAITFSLDQETDTPGPAGRVQVSIFAADALYHVSGTANVVARHLTVGEDLSVERVQRRKWPRRKMDLPVTVCAVSDGMRVEGVPGRTVDVSIGGCCVETLREVEGEGDPMVILSLPDGTSVVTGTSTVEAEDLGDGWRYRLAFKGLDAHDAGRLAELTT